MASENEDGYVDRNRRQRRLFNEINILGSPENVIAVDGLRRSTGGTTELGSALRRQYNSEISNRGRAKMTAVFNRPRTPILPAAQPVQSGGIAGALEAAGGRAPSTQLGDVAARVGGAAGGFIRGQVVSAGRTQVEQTVRLFREVDRFRGAVQGLITGGPQGALEGFKEPFEQNPRDLVRFVPEIDLIRATEVILGLPPKTLKDSGIDTQDIATFAAGAATDPLTYLTAGTIGAMRSAALSGSRATFKATVKRFLPSIARDIEQIKAAQIAIAPRGDAPSTVVARLTERLTELTPVRSETEVLKTRELGERAAKMRAAEASAGTPEDAFFAARAEQAGKLPKAEIPSLAQEFGEQDVSDLLRQIDMVFQTDVFTRNNVKQSLLDLLGRLDPTEGGGLPTVGELEKLEQVFGKDFADALGELAKMPTSLRKDALDALGIPRAILSSFDFSAPGRQGITNITRREFWQNLLPGLKALKNKEFAEAMDDVFRGIGFAEDSPQGIAAARAREHGLDLPRVSARRGGLTTVEEGFQTSVPERIPGIRWVWDQFVGRSQRSYTTFLNGTRKGVFDNTANKFQRFVDDGSMTPEQMSAQLDGMAEWINIGTGRANLSPEIARSAWLVAANRLFFAPRLVISRFQWLARGGAAALDVGLRGVSGAPAARAVNKEIARDFVGFITAGAGALTLGHQFGWIDVELNPQSSDFGKGRAGPTRFDPWGGMQQAARFIMTLSVAAASGDKDEFFRIIKRFTKSKVEPGLVGLTIDIDTGATFIGEPVEADLATIGREARQRLIPLSVQDIWEGFEQEGLVGGLKATPAIVGIGITSFENTQQLKERFGWITEGPGKSEPHEIASILAENPELERELAKRNELGAQAGSEGAQRALDNASDREEAKAKQLALDGELQLWRDGQPGGRPAKSWRDQRTKNQIAERSRSTERYRNVEVRDEAEKTARDRYFDLVDAAELPTGETDWDQVDAGLAVFGQADRDFILRNTGISDTPDEQDYRQFLGEFKTAGGFEWGDQSWVQVQADAPAELQIAANAFESYDQWFEAAVLETLPSAAADLGVALEDDGSIPPEQMSIVRDHATSAIRNRHPIAKAFSRGLDFFQKQWVAANTELAARANDWDIMSLEDIERRYLIQELSR